MKRFTLLLYAASLLWGVQASAAIIYVDIDATGSNNGTSWANAYTDLQDAIAASVGGDEIWIAEGVYKPTSSSALGAELISFEINGKAVDLYGGFNGTESERIQRDWDVYPTILSGAIGSQTDITDNTRQLLDVVNVSNTIRISGIKFQRAYSIAPNDYAAYYVEDCSDVQFSACEFRVNTLDSDAISTVYCDNSKVEFKNCLFRDNTTSRVLGSYLGSEVTVVNCTFTDNVCNEVVTAWSGPLYLYNSILYGNTIESDLFDVTEADYVITGTTSYQADTEGEILVANPLYLDEGSNNFRLADTSPAIDFGSDDYISQGRDLQAGPRIYGAQPDAGCYEVRTPSRIYVDIDATGIENGSTWEHAYTDLQAALSSAIPGDVIWVAEGTYTPGNDQEDSFMLRDGVEMYGGFDGTETARNQRSWTGNLTILTGEGPTSADSDNNFHVLTNEENAASIHLDGFVVRRGRAIGTSPNYGGAAYFTSVDDITLRNTWFTENEAGWFTGGVFAVADVSLEMTGCVFTLNESPYDAAFFGYGEQLLESCFFSGNTASTSGIFKFSGPGNSTASNLTITENTVPSSGDLIRFESLPDSFEMANSVVWNNGSFSEVFDSTFSIDVTASNSIIEGGFTGTNVLDTDPLFVNPGGGDYRLQVTSPGMNASDMAFVTTDTDALANPRVQLGTADWGALESNGAVPGIVYVDPEATGADNGTSWEDAYVHLSDAVQEAAAGSTFWLAEGNHYCSQSTAQTAHLSVTDDSEFYGGFNGTETQLSQRDFAANVTVLSGDIDQDGTVFNNAYNLMLIENGAVVALDGFTVSGANSGIGFSGGIDEGALRVITSTLHADNCIFTNNTAYGSECVAAEDAGQAYLENCLFFGNTSSAGGLVSGLTGNGNIVSLTHCTVVDNSINGSNGVIKGGPSSNVYLYNSIIWQPGHNIGNEIANNEAYNCILHSGTDLLDAFANIRSEYPLFVNPASFDFRITAASNAYDSGNPAYTTLAVDLDGNPRTTDYEVDRGCYESLVCEQPNDLCANAIPLTLDDTPTFGSNRCATNTAGEESTCFVNDGHSVWYSFEAPATGAVTVKSSYVSKFTGIFNMRHVVFGGSCGSLVQLECDNEAGPQVGETTEVSGLTPGETYLIRFDGFASQEGRFTIWVETAAPPAVPGVVYVDADATGAGDGSNWLNAYTELQDALAVVSAGEEVWIAEGTYVNDVYAPTGITFPFICPEGVAIRGGFSGIETSAEQAAPSTHETVISGDGGLPGVETDNAMPVLDVDLANGGFELNGVTIADGWYDGIVAYGALYISSDPGTTGVHLVKVTDVIFRNNVLEDGGSVMRVSDGNDVLNFQIENCLFYQNESQLSMLQLSNTESRAVNNTFTQNTIGFSYAACINANSFGTAKVYNNLCWDNSPNVGIGLTGSNHTEEANLTEEFDSEGNLLNPEDDPLFVNPVLGDFHLMDGSEAAGMGLNGESNETLDLDGEDRIQQANIDAGCYESPYTRKGCTDNTACNFDPLAEDDDASCWYGFCACPGDFDNNGEIETPDLLAILGAFGTSCAENAYCSGDCTGDGNIDTEDVLCLLGKFNTSCD